MGPDTKSDQVLKDEIFNGSDFQVWRSRIHNLLKRRNLLATLEKAPHEEDYFTEPANESQVEQEIRQARLNLRLSQEEEALELIQRRLDNQQFKLVLHK
jgi:hypothetical protein